MEGQATSPRQAAKLTTLCQTRMALLQPTRVTTEWRIAEYDATALLPSM